MTKKHQYVLFLGWIQSEENLYCVSVKGHSTDISISVIALTFEDSTNVFSNFSFSPFIMHILKNKIKTVINITCCFPFIGAVFQGHNICKLKQIKPHVA